MGEITWSSVAIVLAGLMYWITRLLTQVVKSKVEELDSRIKQNNTVNSLNTLNAAQNFAASAVRIAEKQSVNNGTPLNGTEKKIIATSTIQDIFPAITLKDAGTLVETAHYALNDELKAYSAKATQKATGKASLISDFTRKKGGR